MPESPDVARPRYDLLAEPWVPCLGLDGRPRELGLLDVLRAAHDLREVCDSSPLVTYGLYRLLLALLQDRLDPRTEREWKALHHAGRFAAAAVERIRQDDGDRFDLFHPRYPFAQAGDVPPDDPAGRGAGDGRKARCLAIGVGAAMREVEVKPVGYLRPEIPTATNANHFRHAYDARQGYCPGCCARSLTAVGPFAQSAGRGYVPSINGEPPVYVLVTGRTLFETLTLNLTLPAYRPPAAGAADRPTWRGDGTVAGGEGIGTGFVEGLTWLPRRIRLFPAAGGPCTLCGRPSAVLVRRMVYEPGQARRKDAPWWRDPFAAYRIATDRPRALRLQGDHPLWRDYPILLLAASEHHLPAAIVEQAAMLSEDGRGDDRGASSVECFGLRTEQNAKAIEWRRERLPFSPRFVGDPRRAEGIRSGLEAADRVAGLLKTKGLDKLRPRGGKSGAHRGMMADALRGYWGGLADPFRSLAVRMGEPASDPDDLQVGWIALVEATARAAFEEVAESLDADAMALRRAQEARRSFYGALKKWRGQ